MAHNMSLCKKTWHSHLSLLACTEEMMSWWRVQLICLQSFANLWPQLKRKYRFSVTQIEFATFFLHFVARSVFIIRLQHNKLHERLYKQFSSSIATDIYQEHFINNILLTYCTFYIKLKQKTNWKLVHFFITSLSLICEIDKGQKCWQNQFLESYL